MKKVNYLKLIFAVLMAAYGIACARDPQDGSMLDRVNLVAHEAGHLFFSWFGERIQVAGGTLGQLFVPAAFGVYFWFRKEFYSSMVAAFWLGQNFLGISVYISDAQAMELPLLSIGGGSDTIHDWNYMLSKLGVLRWDHTLGATAFWTSVLIMTVAVAGSVYYSFRPVGETG